MLKNLALAAAVAAALIGREAAAAKTGAAQAWRKSPGTYAVFKTGKGSIVCRLFADKTPRTVQNFVGLAEGTQEYVDLHDGSRKKGKFYDGTKFHRVIAGFMIQGGDPLGNGTGGPGYQFDDEIHPDLKFDRPGLLAMANAGLTPDGRGTNGSQFFITDTPRGRFAEPPSYLNGKHTIFGEVVEGQGVVTAIADGATAGGNGMATDPVVLEKVEIVRVPAKGEKKARTRAAAPAQ